MFALCLLFAATAASCGRNEDAAGDSETARNFRPATAARLYVASGLTDQVFRLDPATGDLLATFDVNVRRDELDEPHGLAISPDGRHWYVTVAHGNPTLWKFELEKDRLVGRLQLGARGASRIGLTPDGRFAFVPDYHRAGGGAASGVTVVRTEDLHLVDRLDVCPAPHDAQVAPDGSRVAITCTLSDEIAILDAATLEVVRRFPVGAAAGPPGDPRYRPLNLVWSPDGRFLHVTLSAAGVLRTFSIEGERVADLLVGDGPAQLATSDTGALLVTANRLDGSASVVHVSFPAAGAPALEEVRRVHLGVPLPHGVALTPDGALAFLAYEGVEGRSAGVVAMSTADGGIAWVTEVGAYLLGVAYYAPDSRAPTERR